MLTHDAVASWDGLLATGLLDVTNDPAALDSEGFWAVVIGFEGEVTCARFAEVRASTTGTGPARWRGPEPQRWDTSLGRGQFTAAVGRIREYIAAGEMYQVNLCRILSAPVAPDADILSLAHALRQNNPAPQAGVVRLPGQHIEVATASPELYLRRSGRTVTSNPIKGTGRTESDLLEKDHAENVMIVDLVRNDLGRVCTPGSVIVPELCAVEKHPGLVHLVSSVEGELRQDVGWPDLLAATFPPGSVTGAPKERALRVIGELEPVDRGPYCGAVGWVDADRKRGELAVGIRTFWIDRRDKLLRFGTGAGITWGSDPEREWEETELKARRLLRIAASGASGPAWCPPEQDVRGAPAA
ncbi:chorismate-binding protein [Streptomyces sp. enrichment culture]|uniref:chorismate-binding protein n=1 Tax=Streptomyces sp. enrichment culture TaxID=1795815 RepID=UPI003F54DD16